MARQHATGPEPLALQRHEHLTARLWQRADSDEPIAYRHAGDGWDAVGWADLAERVHAVAAGLVALGVEPGDRVAIMSDTRLEWTVADLAILAVGGVSVPIYATDSVDQCAHILTNSGATTAFAATGDEAKRLEEARGDAPHLEDVFVFDDGGLDVVAQRAGDEDRAQVRRRSDALTVDDLATIVYTSGTTGTPKGCALTHRNLAWTAKQGRARGAVRRGRLDAALPAPGPHLHPAHPVRLPRHRRDDRLRPVDGHAGRRHPVLPTDVPPRGPPGVPEGLRQRPGGGDRREAEGVRLRRRHRAAVRRGRRRGSAHPGRRALADKLVYDKVRASLGGRVRFGVSGGAPLNPDLARFFDAAGISILQGYGLTETSSAVTVDTPHGHRIGTSGRPLPGVEVALDEGEVLVRGDNVFRGYWGNEEETGESLTDDGWYRTGDLGELDDDGYLTITGRAKELIVTAAGKNIAPRPSRSG